MKLTNDPNLPKDSKNRYLNRFQVGDTVYIGESPRIAGAWRVGSRGVIVKVINQSFYEIKWDKKPYTSTFYDRNNWIIPELKTTITRNELIESYEI